MNQPPPQDNPKIPEFTFLLCGFLKNGKWDAVMGVDEKSLDEEKKKFDVFVKYKLVEDR